jgi:hypothetical protein
MATVSTIRAAINAKLLTVATIGVVYDHNVSKVSKYPAAMFDTVDYDNEFLTTAENLRSYTFRITLLAETKHKGLDGAKDLLDTVQNDIIIALESDITLGGVVSWCEPTLGERELEDTPQGLVVTQDVDITCREAIAT